MNIQTEQSKPQPQTAQAFCDSLDIDYKAEFVPQSQSRNAGKEPCLNWRVTVGPITTDYMQGIAHLAHYNHAHSRLAVYNDAIREACETGRSKIRASKSASEACRSFEKTIPAPELVDVLYSLVMDSDAIEYGCFEDWAECFGYDVDSREAEKVYRQCVEIALKLRQAVDLNAAREAFDDY